MEFLGELNFLSVIEEEYENVDGAISLEDYQINEICKLEVAKETKKVEERKSSRIPIRQGRTTKNSSGDVGIVSNESRIFNTNKNIDIASEIRYMSNESFTDATKETPGGILWKGRPNHFESTSLNDRRGVEKFIHTGSSDDSNVLAEDEDFIRKENSFDHFETSNVEGAKLKFPRSHNENSASALNLEEAVVVLSRDNSEVDFLEKMKIIYRDTRDREPYENCKSTKYDHSNYSTPFDKNETVVYSEYDSAENLSGKIDVDIHNRFDGSLIESSPNLFGCESTTKDKEKGDLEDYPSETPVKKLTDKENTSTSINEKPMSQDRSLLTQIDHWRKSNPDSNFPVDEAQIDRRTLEENPVENSGNRLEDIDFRETVQSFLLSELKESSDNFDIAFYSQDPTGTPLVCQESDDPILEAPVEFRSAPEGSKFGNEAMEENQVPPPQPLRVPEEEPPSRDYDNTKSTETGDTTQRSKSPGENETVEDETSENARKYHGVNSSSGTARVFANSTEDNDHVELEGDNRNVSAFGHVGNDAPIQRHDMLQIDRSEPVETVEPLKSSAVPQSCLTQCQISRGCGSLGDALSSSTAEETYDPSLCEKSAKDQCSDRCESCVKNYQDSSFVPDSLSSEVWNVKCEPGSLNIQELLYSISDSGSYSDSSVSSVRNFVIEEFLDDVPEMFSDRYKFKFSALVEDSSGLDNKLLSEQDNNNNVSRISDLFVKECSEDNQSSTVTQDFVVTSAASSTPASSFTEDCRPHVDAHLRESRSPKPLASIHAESRVPAPAPGCSPTKTAAPKGCVGLRQALLPDCISSTPGNREPAEADACQTDNSIRGDEVRELRNLRWSFKNGRLVFDSESDVNDNKAEAPDSSSQEVNLDSIDSSDSSLKLTSKEINKRINENKSRLRYLEEKLRKAGISDEKDKEDCDEADAAKQVVEDSKLKAEKAQDSRGSCDKDRGDSEVNGNHIVDYEDDYAEGLTSFTGGEDFCQFDVSQVGSFPAVLNGYCLVYDELNQAPDSEEEFHVISFEEEPGLEEQFYLLSNNRKNLSAKMGTDSERPKHNPDTENLKSLLKRPGRNRDKQKNRVVFNENKNEFFDADYIILIREECDYDDEDDDSVCTCNQHEMVRLTCCEPNCNCSVYEGYDPTPQSPKFAPPLEFVDAVTLSPPEGYKDMELEEQELFALQQMARRGQQRHAVCRECSATHDDNGDEGDSSQSDEGGGPHSDLEDQGEREKTDQSQQTTPTTPDNCTDDSNLHDFAIDRSPMTATERGYSSDEERREERPTPASRLNVPLGGSPISGILKGGKLWKQPSLDGGTGGNPTNKTLDLQQNTDSSATSDEEGSQRRFVRFIESESNGQRDGCDGASDDHTQEEINKEHSPENERTKQENCHNSVSPDTTEMMLTFKLGNHVLISNNSLKPNSAVRQLFPCTKPTNGKEDESAQQYLVTAESLRAFEEAKRSKLPQIIQSGETDESIKKAIERNTLRRSLIRYEPKSRKHQSKTDNSLVERIKQLTCDVDDVQVEQQESDSQARTSPPGEEARNSPEVTALKQPDKTFSPSSSSTTSSNASSVSSTYKKITDLFTKKTDKPLDNQNYVVNNTTQETKITPTLPDLGNGPHEMDHHPHLPASRINSSTNESRKQFLSSLAPLTACVSGITNVDDYYYQMNNHSNHGGERASVASSVGTEYSLEDIDEALRNDQEDTKRITPDVLAGTPSASESGDELAMFVQQDAGRIERIKKKYQPELNKEEDDEHDDYGFNKRPSVRGIKPRFGTTTQIIQEIQNQMQPPESAGRISWPYYSESGLSNVDNSKSKNQNQNKPHQYPSAAPEEFKTRGYPPPYRPTSFAEENMYQSGQYCRQVYRTNGNPSTYPTLMKVGNRCNDIYQSLPRQKSNGRPLSPPPSEVSRTYHQTMVYIPYNHIEGCQSGVSSNVYYQHSDYARVTNQNQINKRYIDPIYQQRLHMHVEDHHYHYNSGVMAPNAPKQMVRIPYPPQQHVVHSRSESPLPGQFSTAARATQTPAPNSNYYSNPRYRPVIGPAWQGDPTYVSKMNRHSFPMGPRYSTSDTSTDTDSGQGIPPVQNGYRQSIEISFPSQKDILGSSPTKPKFTERGVPEGAASVSPPDTIKLGQSNSSTMTSPTSPQNVTMQSQKPMFYAMNV